MGINAEVAEEDTPAWEEGLLGNSRAMIRVRELVERVACVDTTVLILGASGTGKEVTARQIHARSPRAREPFVPVNCGAIPADLLASELFGHERGAFTGAVVRRKGRFELAGRGTLMLDEIGEMSPDMQIKLLRVIQERKFERLGGQGGALTVEARIIAATHRDLRELVREGRFREDLYYRLNVLPIELPPLRERSEDVPIMIERVSQRLERRGLAPVHLTPEALDSLLAYHWPGNVRQLNNIIERLAVLYPGEVVDPARLPEEITGNAGKTPSPEESRPEFVCANPGFGEGFDLKRHLGLIEEDLIRMALEETGGVIARAARLLGIRRTTLVEKLKRRGLKG